MQLPDALANVELTGPRSAPVDIHAVHYDSRRITPGDLFIAMRGTAVDGNRFIPAAIAAGVAAILTDSPEVFAQAATLPVPVLLASSGRRALAGIAANLLHHPERTLKISAVTGTNGKTTTAWLLEQILRTAGRQTVLLGTIETHVGDQVRPSEHTTPEASDLLQTFADGVALGATEAIMEMSSHALEQERVWGIPVDAAIFTNLTQDHLDYHRTMDAYFLAKARLFRGVGTPAPRVAVLNADDPHTPQLREIAHAAGTRNVWTYGIESSARKCPDFHAESVHLLAGASTFRLNTPAGGVDIHSPLTGKVNVLNFLAASCAAFARGLTLDQIAHAAARLQQVPGRFQTVANTLGFTVVVDYAHTDDALRNLIALARALAGPARVITLFGCGGDRDRTKRPKMGRAAGEASDLVVLTSDNPRTEDPAAILNEVLTSLRATPAQHIVEPDRAVAIALAIHAAHPGDIVLIAGKGHEKVQILASGTVPFDDVALAQTVLRKRESKEVPRSSR